VEAARINQEADADELRAQLHGMWNAVAGGWAAHAAFADERGAVVAGTMLGAAGVQPGDRVLELACGPGGVGLAASRLVGPEGVVVVSDVAPAMTAIARSRAERLGLENVEIRELDLEQIDEPDASFDVVLCREGLMLVQDPALALREIARVLRPGGRVSVAVWGPREKNPWLALVFDAVTAELGIPMPPVGTPGPFSLDDPATVFALVAEAGLSEGTVREIATPYRAPSAEEWWTRTVDLAGPLAKRLAMLPEPAAQALRARAYAAVGPYETVEGLEIPGLSLVAAATAR
jgi:SAM-dependent methyltransferase